MPFTVEDFHDLVQLLEDRPEWRAEMRRLVMSDEYLAVPEQIAELQRQTAEQQSQTAELQRQVAELQRQVAELQRQVAELQRQVAELQRQVAELQRQVAELERKVEQLQIEVAELRRDLEQLRIDMERRFGQVQVRLDQLTTDVAQLKGDNLERRYREHAYSYFGRLIHKSRVIGKQQLFEMLDEAVEHGVLSQGDREQVGWADLVMSGRWIADGRQVIVLAEISVLVDLNDVQRAADRAGLLAKLGTPVVPVVAGDSITERAAAMAQTHNVWQMLNGRSVEPLADAPGQTLTEPETT